MATIIDGQGREEDIEPYRRRIVVPDERKSEIYDWVEVREREFKEYSQLNHGEFERLIRSFMGRATYTGNLLDLPYKASEDALQKVADYCGYLLPLRGDYDKINRAMYHVEKAIRIGADVRLGECDRETIMALERELFRAGGEEHGRLVKMLGRHKVLGLPEPETEVKKCLEPIPSQLIFWDWMGCAALRAGLRLEPIYSWQLNRKIEVGIEQKQEKSFDLDLYVSGMHHLHRLLDSEPQEATE